MCPKAAMRQYARALRNTSVNAGGLSEVRCSPPSAKRTANGMLLRSPTWRSALSNRDSTGRHYNSFTCAKWTRSRADNALVSKQIMGVNSNEDHGVQGDEVQGRRSPERLFSRGAPPAGGGGAQPVDRSPLPLLRSA